MANDLSTPLTGRKRRSGPEDQPGGRRGLPIARILFTLIVLIAAGFVYRLMMVNDPEGGRPSEEVAITSTRNANSVANEIATGPVTITADPGETPASPSITTVDEPAATTAAASATQDAFGVLPDLAEETKDGPIPRIAANGETPFTAYSRASTISAPAGSPMIAVIVTGLGINEQGSLDAIDELPEDFTLAFAPYGKSLPATVAAARSGGHEVFLEIPLEPFDYPQNDPGPQTLLTGEEPRSNLEKLFWLMSRFGGYAGVINNMGARFTASTADFAPVMEELGSRGLGYIDDGSSNRSLAEQFASANEVPFNRADLVVDANPAREPILEALSTLEARATQTGSAIGLISALPISISTVTEWSQQLANKGITLVPASALMK